MLDALLFLSCSRQGEGERVALSFTCGFARYAPSRLDQSAREGQTIPLPPHARRERNLSTR